MGFLHKHAEVLMAIARGEPVQYEYIVEGVWINTSEVGSINPLSYPGYKWRVKPPEWQEKLREAAREGQTIERRFENGAWSISLLTGNPYSYKFGKSHKESDYRIAPRPKQSDCDNRAVNCFLELYKANGMTVGTMARQLRLRGSWDEPEWVISIESHILTPGRAQAWLRFLFALDIK